jgi:hypothetical protein
MALLGFNTDFKYRGDTYHVQTEDNGVTNPAVLTLLYFKGAILASKKTSYRDLLEKPGFEKEVMEIMKSQHKQIMKELLAGAYDGYLGGAPATAAAAAAPAEAPPAAPAPAPAAAAPPPAAAPLPRAPAAAPPVAAPPPPPAAAAPPPRTASPPAARPVAPRAPAAPPSLDQAIMHYLEEYAAAAAGSASTRH